MKNNWRTTKCNMMLFVVISGENKVKFLMCMLALLKVVEKMSFYVCLDVIRAPDPVSPSQYNCDENASCCNLQLDTVATVAGYCEAYSVLDPCLGVIPWILLNSGWET